MAVALAVQPLAQQPVAHGPLAPMVKEETMRDVVEAQVIREVRTGRGGDHLLVVDRRQGTDNTVLERLGLVVAIGAKTR